MVIPLFWMVPGHLVLVSHVGFHCCFSTICENLNIIPPRFYYLWNVMNEKNSWGSWIFSHPCFERFFFQEILPFSCYLWIFIIFLPTQVLGNINLIFLSKYCSILIWVSPYFASTVQNFKWAKWIFLISLYFSWGKNVWYLPRQGVASHTLFMFQHCSDF